MRPLTAKQKQHLLGYLGYYAGEIDGAWGEMSQAATRAFQRDYGLTADGIFGVGTEARIREVVASGETPRHTRDVPETGGADWWKDIRYFKRAEFRCPCGRCGGFPVEPQESIARTVDEIRHRLGIPISIVDGGGSGVRCSAHNAEVGGVSDSQHLYGLAADLHSAASPAQMLAVAEDVMGHTGGLGLYSWGIHVDKRSGYARWNG